MKIGAIIQARTSSTRLPGKVLMNLPYGSKTTVLEQVIRRVKKAVGIDEVAVATTTDKTDDGIVKLAKKEGVKWFRGSKENVLQRYYQAAKKYHYDIIVRITSDCPCIDPVTINTVLRTHLKQNSSYTSNEDEPRGLNVEVVNFNILKTIYEKATKDFEKEHVFEYIITSHPEKFKIITVKNKNIFHSNSLRLTLDTRDDYTFLCTVYDFLYKKSHFFNIYDIARLIRNKPWLLFINQHIMQKKI